MRTSNIIELRGAANDAGLSLSDLWRAFLSNPDIALAAVRPDVGGEFRVVEVNDAGRIFLRGQPEEAVGKTVKEAALDEIGGFLEARLRVCVETGRPQSYERSVDLPDGRQSWTTNLLPVTDRNGRIEAIIAMSRLIPPHMDAAGIDERNRSLIEGLSSTAPGILYLYDPHSMRANFVGGQVEALLGYKAHELEEMPNPLAQLVHPDDLSWVAGHIANVVVNPCDQVSVFECRVRQKSGEYRLLACHNRVLDRSADGHARTLIGIANDVTDQEHLRKEVETLTSRLSNVQMEERRLIAQELHDSAGQYIVAAELALMGAQETAPELSRDRRVSRALGEVMDCLKDAEREIRVLSYLLHPPAISSQGLATVLRNFAEGFGGRAGITVDVSVDRKVNTAPNQLAVPLLRICQEALTNVHRHAKASAVAVKLDVRDGTIDLTISDDGVGFDPADESVVRGIGSQACGSASRASAGPLRCAEITAPRSESRFPCLPSAVLHGFPPPAVGKTPDWAEVSRHYAIDRRKRGGPWKKRFKHWLPTRRR